MHGDVSQILVKAQKERQINNFSDLSVKKMSDIRNRHGRIVRAYTNTVKVRGTIYPLFSGSIIKLNLDIVL